MSRIKIVIFVFLAGSSAWGAPGSGEVADALKKAAGYFRGKAGVNGGYVYYYSPDLDRRLGEGAARESEIWVQPPGTPTVGLAFLSAYEATNDAYFLECAREAGKALMHGQLESGGWRNSIDFDPSGPRSDRYRNGKGNPKGTNNSTLDDGITQTALEFLFKLDRALNFADHEVNAAARYGLDALLKAQFPIGAFPQVWKSAVEAHPPADANYPGYDWRTEGRIKNYWDMYTLNDGLAGSVVETLIAADRIYDRADAKRAVEKLGDFLIRAQMPDPQPAWAQQYNYSMQPIWARKFEPAAIAGRESEDVMIALLKIAEHTGDGKYLEPIVSGVKFLEQATLPDGRLPRYLELKTNKPLYMERKGDVYTLTHDDSNLPDHYGWKNETRLELIKSGYRAVKEGKPISGVLDRAAPADDEAERIVGALDAEGRWISRYAGELLVGQPKFREGEEYISSKVFAENVEALCRYLGR